MTINGEEFLRRFSLHILPKAFVKIRHFGIFSARSVNLLHITKCIMFGHPATKREKPAKKNWKLICKEKMNFDPDLCPHCKKGEIIVKEFLEKPKRGPTERSSWNNLQIST